jgi:mannose-6-phosphate isomerase-like protein (cupin superfamily)
MRICMMFETKYVPIRVDELAPDGSEVRLLMKRPGGSMAHFRLEPGKCSSPVAHRTVDELWYVVNGVGELWRQSGEAEEITPLQSGVCVSIPAGVAFQFRTTGQEALEFIAVTMPPWPGPDEAFQVAGCTAWAERAVISNQ